jgi:hypothetical protein
MLSFLKKILDRFFLSGKVGGKRGRKNETGNSTHKPQTLFMVVAGQSCGVACATEKI